MRHRTPATALPDYSDWPALTHVFQVTRTWQQQGLTTTVVHYGGTSLPPDLASAERLLALKRGHWSSENQLHDVTDVRLGDERRLSHRGTGPRVMALLRDTLVALRHQAGCSTIAARLR